MPCTARARSIAPLAPSPQWVHRMASVPSARIASCTAAISASVSPVKRLSPTTTGMPNLPTFSTWRARLTTPRFTAATSSRPRSDFATPPCILSARTVATTTQAAGASPALRHLMSRNFSAPRSAPKPASVTTTSASFRPRRVAITELQPWAILAKGPPWTSAGEPSMVCTRLGAKASRSSTAMAPSALSSAAVTDFPSRVWPTIMRPSRACRSARSRARQNTAMTSEATVMSKPSSRGKPFATPPSEETTERSARSFMSSARRQETRRASSPSALPQ